MKKKSENDAIKVRGFVDHLLENPNIKCEPLIIGEGLIMNFLVQNLEQLKVTFSTPQFFPHLEWNQVLAMIFDDLYSRVSGIVLPVINEFIDRADFNFFDSLSSAGSVSDKFYREKLHDYVQLIFKNKDARYNMNSVINIFEHDVIEKYVTEIFARRDYLYNELVRVQRTNLDSGDYIVFLKVLLLIKNIVHVKIPINPENTRIKLNISDVGANRKKVASYINSLSVFVKNQLPMFSDRTVKLALKSNLQNSSTETDEASSRFLFIMTSRFQNYKYMESVDRGAESPDKSWFAVARKNAGHFGYDKRILDDLYMIAGDNNW